MGEVDNNELNVDSESGTMVVRQDLLREIIVKMAIQPGNINRETVVSLREIGKCWRDTVSRLLYLQKRPLYIVKLDEHNSVNGTEFVNRRGKALDLFTSVVGDMNDYIKLKICEDFFRLENYGSFSNCLKLLSNCLLELETIVPLKAGSFPGLLPFVGLPNLQKVSITFTSTHLENLEYDMEDSLCHSSCNTTMLLQSLLAQTTDLKELTFCIDAVETLSTPPGIQYLSLPNSIQKLNLNCRLTNPDLAILQRNCLSALTHLTLEMNGFPVLEDSLYSILNTVKNTLTNFFLKTKTIITLEENPVKIPEMKVLRQLGLVGSWVLDEDTRANLNDRLPKLNNLQLMSNQRQLALNSWIDNTNLHAVRTLFLVTPDLHQDHGTFRFKLVVPTPTTMAKFNTAMPNITQLTLKVGWSFLVDLRLLFPCLERLKLLKIYTTVAQDEIIENSDLWDSLLSGLPEEVVKVLRLNPNFDQNFEITVKQNDNAPSIRMLKNLRMLNLVHEHQSTESTPFLSESSFKFAFLRVPTLTHLVLSGRFQVSPSLEMAWKKSGRFICQNGYQT